jgi:ribonuclease Z
MRLSQIGLGPGQLNAVFFTHMHSDHTEGFADIMQLRWVRNSAGPKIDVVCSAEARAERVAGLVSELVQLKTDVMVDRG